MLLGAYLPSRGAVAALGSLFDAAMERGWGLRWVVDDNAKDPVWPGDLARWEDAEAIGRPDLTVGLAGDPRGEVGVASWWDNIITPPVPGQRVGYLSAWHRTRHAANFPAHRAWISRQPVIGWTLADHRALLPSVPLDLDTVMFSLKRAIPEPWRRSHTGRRWYRRRVWHWARRTLPARLVIKTRPKHGDPWWLPLAGQVIPTLCAYPHTSLALLNRARQVVHFTSGAGLEARLFPHIERIVDEAVPLTHLHHLPGVLATYRHLDESPLQDIITYDDTAAALRMLDALPC